MAINKVLLVDDSPTDLANIRTIVSDAGYSVLTASSGNEAVEMAKKELPDLIFMDIKLAEESGLELTREIKKKHPDVVIVIFTNHDLPEYRQRAGICGAEFFLSKLDSEAHDLTQVASAILNQEKVKL